MSATIRHSLNPYRRALPVLAAAAIALLASPPVRGETPGSPPPTIAAVQPDISSKINLATYWARLIGIGMNLLCVAYECKVDKSSDTEKYIFFAPNVKIPLPDLSLSSNSADKAMIHIGEIELQSSRNGIADLNGFPDFLNLAVRDIRITEGMAKNLAKMVAPSDVLTQQLLSQELSKAKLFLNITAQQAPDGIEVKIVAGANASDMITADFTFYIPDAVKNALIHVKRTGEYFANNDEYQKGDRLDIAIDLYESVNWPEILNIPVPKAIVAFKEYTLLDKFYTKFLFSRKTDGEREYWQKMLSAVLAEPVSDNRKSAAEIIRFLSNWREEAHRLTVTVTDPNATELFSKPSIEKMVGQDSPYCAIGMVLSASIGAYYAFLPYIMPDDDAAIRAARDAAGFGDDLKNDTLKLGTTELMKFARCNKVALSATYKSP